ncbi:competence type IV pilus major pilin ComGC [Bacillus sp. FJAT-45350]|uniref:competence type IV pilus major pilin ComGC n=1 Tax=Bacillus sp. FJAT-45350 TaxID=2011014 RepID=UPI000BB680B9|nr:competence type IV pilus major pilin ComGC [Bacillus sp. FJAT-45350]
MLKNDSGFTLIEMMIVLMIISILLLIAVPNMTKNNTVASSKGCDATVDLLQAQVGAYEIETGESPANLQVLKEKGYVDRIECSDKTQLKLEGGIVKRVSE